jgi:hypothetical protein
MQSCLKRLDRRARLELTVLVQDTNEFGVLTAGNIVRTYFRPIIGVAYFVGDFFKYTT